MGRDFAEERERMVAAQIASRDIEDKRLLAAMRKVRDNVDELRSLEP